MNHVAKVNRAIREAGGQEKLTRGRGYYYFRFGNTARWPATAVYVNHSNQLTVEQWLAEYNRMKEIA